MGKRGGVSSHPPRGVKKIKLAYYWSRFLVVLHTKINFWCDTFSALLLGILQLLVSCHRPKLLLLLIFCTERKTKTSIISRASATRPLDTSTPQHYRLPSRKGPRESTNIRNSKIYTSTMVYITGAAVQASEKKKTSEKQLTWMNATRFVRTSSGLVSRSS